jgi:hypothetical protein
MCRGCVANHVRACCICKDRPSTDFTNGQWTRATSRRARNACPGGLAVFVRNRKLQFSRQQPPRNAEHLCYDCDRKRCCRCNKEKGYKDFSHALCDLDVGSPELLCTECVAGQRKHGFWKCANKRCGKQTPHSEFGRAIAQFGQRVRGDSRQCDACLERRAEELAEMMRSSLEHVQKKSKQ